MLLASYPLTYINPHIKYGSNPIIRQLGPILFVVVYLPNGPNETNEDIIHNTVSQIQSDKPESAVIVIGDFNDPSFTISNFTQYVTCSTRNQRTIDLCFSNGL